MAFAREDGVLGGAERYAFELARTMAERVPTALLTFGVRPALSRLGSLEVIVERGWAVRGQRANPWHPAIAKWVARADIVHCHQTHVLASSTAAAIGRLLGRPVFVTELGGGGFDISAYWDTTRWYSGHLHISQYSRHIYGHAELDRAVVIGGGVDTEKFSPDRSVKREGVLFVGRILPHKGINYLVDAIDADSLRIIGMPYGAAFFAELQRLAQGKRVRFEHGLDDSRLVSAYRGARVLVLPSVYKTLYGDFTTVPELLGQTLLEAMACETPVICTNVASMPEVVEDGKCGFVVPPNDPAALAERLRWLREHPDEAKQMGRAGRKRVLALFTWPAVVARCLERYQRLERRGAAPAA